MVWADIDATRDEVESDRGRFAGTGSGPANATILHGGYHFTHTISPASIITDTDRPNLSGSNAVDPPGGVDLKLGANKKWDGSRQKRAKIVNPANISDSDITSPPPVNLASYPIEDALGNDDQTTNDPEINDPYTNGGDLTGVDAPSAGILDSAGSINDTYEYRLQFREFTRLELNGTWVRISDYFLWRIHLKFKKNASIWFNNGSELELDNEGFS